MQIDLVRRFGVGEPDWAGKRGECVVGVYFRVRGGDMSRGMPHVVYLSITNKQKGNQRRLRAGRSG
jgi:hypothetical protein